MPCQAKLDCHALPFGKARNDTVSGSLKGYLPCRFSHKKNLSGSLKGFS
ncbi:MAG: hypothetical protein IJV35_02870 [Neisseriaceae bacterium]|nr:hypothetical protein [Neisseriaceae bacterium]